MIHIIIFLFSKTKLHGSDFDFSMAPWLLSNPNEPERKKQQQIFRTKWMTLPNFTPTFNKLE